MARKNTIKFSKNTFTLPKSLSPATFDTTTWSPEFNKNNTDEPFSGPSRKGTRSCITL